MTTYEKLVKLMTVINRDLMRESNIPVADAQTRLENVSKHRAWILERLKEIVDTEVYR